MPNPASSRRTTLLILIGAALVAAGTPLRAQRPRGDRDAAPDPYTKNEPEALARAGYVSLGPFTWGDRHDSLRVAEDLGGAIRWIETAHFKIGSTLPAKAVPRDKEQRGRTAAELAELAEKLPEVKSETRTLDPWLRTHLFAHRLEGLYARVSELLGVDDGAFVPNGQLGRGPHLGVRGKFLVLLCDKQSTCGRYLSTFAGISPEQPSRWYYPDTDCFLFATAEEYGDGAFRADIALHAHVVFNVGHCLLDAYKGYSYVLPSWWKEGLCHSLRRAVSTEHNNYSRIADPGRAYAVYDWDVKVRQRLDHELIRPLAEIAGVADCEGFTLVDHMACWSRVEFLLAEREKFAAFVARMKGAVDSRGMPLDHAGLVELQARAIRDELGHADAEALDAAWAKWVVKTYRKKT